MRGERRANRLVTSGVFAALHKGPRRTNDVYDAARNSFAKRNAFATPPFQFAAILRAASYRVRAVAMRLDACLERRRAAAASLAQLNAMTDRELRDIGLTRFDVQNTAWGVSTRDAHSRQLGYCSRRHAPR